MVDYDQIPEDLRWERQWCIAGPDSAGKFKAPTAKGNNNQLFYVKPTQSDHWKDLETTIEHAQQFPGCGVGFILTRKDPFTVIDLDVKNEHNYPNKVDANGKPIEWTSPEELARYDRIIAAFDSYTERSASGQGYHIWVRGSIGEGVRRDGVEVYSQDRFIVCTGDVHLNREIEPRQDLLNILVGEIRAAQAKHEAAELVEVGEEISDMEVFNRAKNADNAEKFIRLCEGDFSNYPSQSEADLALMSIFAFYSKSNEQCRRVFRMTKLGEREKATKNDVALNRILKVIRSRQNFEAKADAYGKATADALMASMGVAPAPVLAPAPAAPAAPYSAPEPAPAPLQQQQPQAAYSAPITAAPKVEHIPLPEEIEGINFDPYEDEEVPEGSLEWPPGMVGALARFVYGGAPRPVREVAIVAALGLMAGVCGKVFYIPQSGLNLYIVLVARSAIGKEAMHSGIGNVLSYLNMTVPEAMNFVDFNDYASGPALIKTVSENTSFVNVSGEWGRKLRRLSSEDGRDGPMQSLRTAMTNLYQKSGPNSVVGGIGYSDKEKNALTVSGAAYSMIGESTPSTFYEALTENMMEDGFLSRFTIIEYAGERPETNRNPITTPDDYLGNALCGLFKYAYDLLGSHKNVFVNRDAEAAYILDAFDLECDGKIKEAGDNESVRQMWNRAHLKVMRIAALLAVGDNPSHPVMQRAHVEWALTVVRKDIAMMRSRMSTGDVGIGDGPREKKVLSLVAAYVSKPVPASYGIPDNLRIAGIVPRKYLQILTQRSTSFTGHRNGQSAALDTTLKSLIDSGYLMEVGKDKLLTEYSFHGRAFRILQLPEELKNKKVRSK